MYLELQQQSVLLGRRPSGFTEHYYTEWDDGLGKERISLFLVMSIDSTQVPGAEIGKEAFQLLQDHFLDDLSGDPYDRFEAALREINLMINDKEKELDLKFVPNMNVLIGVIQKDMLFLSQRGTAQGYLVRKRHVSSITDGLSDQSNKEDLFQNIASGSMEVGDSVIFVTGHLVQYITPSDLSKIFTEQNLQVALKEMSDLLHNDLEDQMAVLSFEVLEKSHVPMDQPVGSESEDSEGSEGMESTLEIPELKSSKRASREQIQEAMGRLQGWLKTKERLERVNVLKRWDKKQLIMAITAVLAVLVVGVLLLNFGLGRSKQLENLENKLSTAESNVTQAATRGAFDKTEAQTLLDEAEVLAVEVLNSGHMGPEASQVLDDIETQRQFLDNVVVIEDDSLTLIADMTGILGSSEILGLSPMGERVVVYTGNQAYQVLLGDVQDPTLLDDTETVQAASYFADRDLLTLLTNEGNLIEYSDGNAQFADSADGSFYNAVDLASYSTRLYVLDPSQSEIWKYNRGTNSYSGASPYLVDDVDLSDAVSMAIDGSVWLLHEDGRISRLLSGESLEFDILKAPLSSIEGATDIYTELEINQVYVLDPAMDRILIYDKSAQTDNLTYSQQYVFEDLKGELTDLYVDKDRDVIVFTTTEALYELQF